MRTAMAQYAPLSASPEWHPSLSNQHRSNILNHTKRKAEDDLDLDLDLESQAHISSQFKKLRLNQNQNQNLNKYNATAAASQIHTAHHHYPVPSAPPSSPQYAEQISSPILFRPLIANTDARPGLVVSRSSSSPSPGISHHDFAHPFPDSDPMTLDPQSHSAPNRIIITDLSSEIAQIEADEALATPRNHLIFPDDIDKKVSAFSPHHLLTRGQNHDRHAYIPRPPENLSTALILYKEPSSISVPEEEDVVRKTIIEARKRAREKTAAEQQLARELRAREEETRALQHHWDDGMIDHSFQAAEISDGEGEMDEVDLDPMDIE